jgi:hypothetical protein
MNVALEQTEEYSNGRLTGRFGECFLRGNNGMFIPVFQVSFAPPTANDDACKEESWLMGSIVYLGT